MALYVVVHHQRDKNQPWINAWLSDELIEAIQTTSEIGNFCQQAKARGERLYVHRCGWQECPPAVCCSAEVVEVAAIDKSTALVRFAGVSALDENPPRVPVKGQNYYLA